MSNKFCIGYMTFNELKFCQIHLKAIKEYKLPVVVVDGGSTDGTQEFLRKNNFDWTEIPFKNDWGQQANNLLQFALENDYGYMLRLDPDEMMFLDGIHEIIMLLSKYDAIMLPRFNFEGDVFNYSSLLWPDIQCRAYDLSKVYYVGKVHERLTGYIKETNLNFDPTNYNDGLRTTIYHYEGLLDKKKRFLKGMNYQRIVEGKEPLTELPEQYENYDFGLRHREPFPYNIPLGIKTYETTF